MEVKLHAFYIFALDGGEWSALYSSSFTRSKEFPPGACGIGVCMYPRATQIRWHKENSLSLPEIKHWQCNQYLVTLLTDTSWFFYSDQYKLELICPTFTVNFSH